MLCSTTYTLCQTTEVDGQNEIECSTSRTLEFEVGGAVDSEGYVDDMHATLVRITETCNGVVLDCRKFKASEDAAKCYGEWFDEIVSQDDDLRWELERLLVEDRDAQKDEDADRAWRNSRVS